MVMWSCFTGSRFHFADWRTRTGKDRWSSGRRGPVSGWNAATHQPLPPYGAICWTGFASCQWSTFFPHCSWLQECHIPHKIDEIAFQDWSGEFNKEHWQLDQRKSSGLFLFSWILRRHLWSFCCPPFHCCRRRWRRRQHAVQSARQRTVVLSSDSLAAAAPAALWKWNMSAWCYIQDVTICLAVVLRLCQNKCQLCSSGILCCTVWGHSVHCRGVVSDSAVEPKLVSA